MAAPNTINRHPEPAERVSWGGFTHRSSTLAGGYLHMCWQLIEEALQPGRAKQWVRAESRALAAGV